MQMARDIRSNGLLVSCAKIVSLRREHEMSNTSTPHWDNAYLDNKPWGHGGQVLLQSQLEVFINLIWNQERHKWKC